MPTDRASRAGRLVMQVAALCVGGALAGVAVNAARARGLPLRTSPFDYQFECEEERVDSKSRTLSVDEVARAAAGGGVVLVDIRSAEAFQAGRLPGARHMPVSVVAPTDPIALRSLSGAGRIVVYDDGAELGRAEEFAGELQSAGVENVQFLAGGFAAWVAAGRDVDKGAPP